MTSSLLWQIVHPSVSHPSYLFGTMHRRPRLPADWMAPLEPFIFACDQLATEFDLNATDTQLIQWYSQLPDGQTWTDFVSAKKLDKWQPVFQKAANLDARPFYSFKPFVFLNQLTERLLAPNGQLTSMDQELFERATAFDKPRIGIEAFGEQLAVLDRISLTAQFKNLERAARNIRQFRLHQQRLSDLYLRGEIDKIYQLSKRGLGKLRYPLLHRRNAVMTERFVAIIAEKTLFCAVGAGHLAGKRGLLRGLKLAGCKVCSVPFSLTT